MMSPNDIKEAYKGQTDDTMEANREATNCTQLLGDSRHSDTEDVTSKDIATMKDSLDVDVIREPHTSTTFKWIKTICLYLGFVGLGLIETLIGPTLLDLKEQVGVDTAQISILFTTHSAGYMLGSIIGGYLIDRFNQSLIIAFALFLGGVFAVVSPWFYNFGLVALFLGFLGVTSGMLDTCGNVILMLIWGIKSDPFFQFLHFAFGVGATITPLIAQPFISKEIIGTAQMHSNLSDIESTLNPYGSVNSTDFGNSTSEVSLNSTDFNGNGTSGDVHIVGRTESKVQYIYLIVGLYNATFGICFFVITAFGKRTIRALKYESDEDHEETYGTMTLKYKIQMLIFLFMIYFLYCGMEVSAGGLVMAFSKEGLGWPKELGPMLTSTFWGAFMVSRLAGVFLTKILSLTQMIAVDMLIALISFLVMAIFVNSHYIVLWITMATAGIGMGSVFASVMSWYQRNVMPVTGYVAGLSLVSASISGTTVPLLTGFIMNKVNYMGFPYMLLALQFGLTVIAGSIYLSVRMHKKACAKENGKRDPVEEVEMMMADKKQT